MFATAMRIHVSADTAAALHKLDASFRLDLRGEVDMKVGNVVVVETVSHGVMQGKGVMTTYWLREMDTPSHTQ